MAVDERDPVLAFDYVLSLARRHLTAAQAVTAVDETGGEARAYVIDDVYVFKTQRPHRVRSWTSIAKAKFHQDALARTVPKVSVPRVLGYGREGTVEYVLETRMPGAAFRTVTITGEKRRQVLIELGRTLRRIHSLPLPEFEQNPLFPNDDTPAAVRARTATALQRGVDAVGSQTREWGLAQSPKDLAATLLDALPDTGQRVPLHSNPGPEHVFVHPDSLTFSGLIDFGDAYISHPAFDMRRWTTPQDRSALLLGYTEEGPVDDTFRAYWRVLMVGSVMTIYGMRPERREQAVRDLRSLVGGEAIA